jgi:HPt (histidine-containing phosphotransfer) domain-containing protein
MSREANLAQRFVNQTALALHGMSYQFAGLDAAIAAVAGEDDVLMRDLRRALEESAAVQLDLLRRSRCDANWRLAASRLSGLAASFGAAELSQAAQAALQAAPGDPSAIRSICKAIDALAD